MNARGSSAIVRGARAVGRTLRSIDEGFARAAADRNAGEDADEARVRAIIGGSAIVRVVERCFEAPELAWRHSRARAIAGGAMSAFLALDLPSRVRLIGWMIVVAVVTRGAIHALMGNPLTRWTLVVWGALAFAGLFMMIASRAVAAAWVDWNRRA
ncbi:MAG: hypothetical protein IT176_14485 [Acidobacteria bacterium]|nr:hypothetical protein [Acidobacteriota bacterium]